MSRDPEAWADEEGESDAEFGDSVSALDALDVPNILESFEHGLALFGVQPDDPPDREPQTLLFTIANPLYTVSVTASLSGQVVGISLTHGATQMTEKSLAEEITVLASLVQRRARAAQHALIAHSMTSRGHDPAMVRAYLERQASLPSPESAQAQIAELFASRYAEGCV